VDNIICGVILHNSMQRKHAFIIMKRLEALIYDFSRLKISLYLINHANKRKKKFVPAYAVNGKLITFDKMVKILTFTNNINVLKTFILHYEELLARVLVEAKQNFFLFEKSGDFFKNLSVCLNGTQRIIKSLILNKYVEARHL
jgi:hypothetical protein